MKSILRLNRTFYGIETLLLGLSSVTIFGLNRTFYGIETGKFSKIFLLFLVLIVPFMELKLCGTAHGLHVTEVLIVPFMELKHYHDDNDYWKLSVLIVPFMELKLIPELTTLFSEPS